MSIKIPEGATNTDGSTLHEMVLEMRKRARIRDHDDADGVVIPLGILDRWASGVFKADLHLQQVHNLAVEAETKLEKANARITELETDTNELRRKLQDSVESYHHAIRLLDKANGQVAELIDIVGKTNTLRCNAVDERNELRTMVEQYVHWYDRLPICPRCNNHPSPTCGTDGEPNGVWCACEPPGEYTPDGWISHVFEMCISQQVTVSDVWVVDDTAIGALYASEVAFREDFGDEPGYRVHVKGVPTQGQVVAPKVWFTYNPGQRLRRAYYDEGDAAKEAELFECGYGLLKIFGTPQRDPIIEEIARDLDCTTKELIEYAHESVGVPIQDD